MNDYVTRIGMKSSLFQGDVIKIQAQATGS